MHISPLTSQGQILVGKALTSLSISHVMGGPIQGLLLLVFPPVAAVVVVVVALLWGHPLQGILVEVHGVRALRGQRGNRALHGAGVRDGLQGTGRDTERGQGRRRAPLGRLLPGMEGLNGEREGQGGGGENMVNWRQPEWAGGLVGCGLSGKFGE